MSNSTEPGLFQPYFVRKPTTWAWHPVFSSLRPYLAHEFIFNMQKWAQSSFFSRLRPSCGFLRFNFRIHAQINISPNVSTIPETINISPNVSAIPETINISPNVSAIPETINIFFQIHQQSLLRNRILHALYILKHRLCRFASIFCDDLHDRTSDDDAICGGSHLLCLLRR